MAKKTSKPTTAAKQGKPKPAKPRKVVEKSSDDISATELIDARIKELGDWRSKLLSRIRRIIKQADPEVVEEVKWRKPSNSMLGVPVWNHDGIICTGETAVSCETQEEIDDLWAKLLDIAKLQEAYDA